MQMHTQTNMFDAASRADDCTKHALGEASLSEFPQAFNADYAKNMCAELVAVIPWRQESLRIAGKVRNVPRLQCWMGDRESYYGYSGMRLQAEPWNSQLLEIKQRVEELSNQTFNSVLLNFYRDGRDSVAWHADDEDELGPEPVIASVSFGAERKFQLKHKFDKNKGRIDMLLRHGSLLVMHSPMQKYWLHQLPKEPGLMQGRINLTFRTII